MFRLVDKQHKECRDRGERLTVIDTGLGIQISIRIGTPPMSKMTLQDDLTTREVSCSQHGNKHQFACLPN